MTSYMAAGSKGLFALLLILSCLLWVRAKTGPSHDKVVVCYISTWAVYRPNQGAYRIEHFDPNLCTHAIYAFAGLDITQSAIKSLDPWQDLKEDYGKGGYEHLTEFKSTHPHLKVSLAIGGWNEGSKNYSIMAADPFQRERFVKHVTNFITKYNFDGLDLDWEYPTQRGGSPHDRENFVLLTKELRQEFDKHGRLLLTSAIGAAKNVIDEAYNVRELSRYLDFLHIMCYDYHGNWDKKIGYNAPLTAPGEDILSVQYTIDYLIKLGAPPSKLVMGLPFYGRTFNSPQEGNIGDATEGKPFQGPYTREDGFLGYNEICSILSNKSLGWTSTWDAETAQMLARSPRDEFTGQVQVVTYDSTRSIANKVKFALQRKLGGLMVWSIDTDDFQGDCSLSENTYDDFKYNQIRSLANKYPLLNTINSAVNVAKYEIEREQAELEVPNEEENEIPGGSIEDHKGENNSAVGLSVLGLFFVLKTQFLLVLC